MTKTDELKEVINQVRELSRDEQLNFFHYSLGWLETLFEHNTVNKTEIIEMYNRVLNDSKK